MTSLLVLILFLMLSISSGKQIWKSRAVAYTVLFTFAFLQATLVLFDLFRMKPPAH